MLFDREELAIVFIDYSFIILSAFCYRFFRAR